MTVSIDRKVLSVESDRIQTVPVYGNPVFVPVPVLNIMYRHLRISIFCLFYTCLNVQSEGYRMKGPYLVLNCQFAPP